MSKLGKAFLISGAVVATTALAIIGYVKIVDTVNELNCCKISA